MREKSSLPIICIVLVVMVMFSNTSADGLAVLLSCIGILAFCAGRRFG